MNVGISHITRNYWYSQHLLSWSFYLSYIQLLFFRLRWRFFLEHVTSVKLVHALAMFQLLNLLSLETVSSCVLQHLANVTIILMCCIITIPSFHFKQGGAKFQQQRFACRSLIKSIMKSCKVLITLRYPIVVHDLDTVGWFTILHLWSWFALT